MGGDLRVRPLTLVMKIVAYNPRRPYQRPCPYQPPPPSNTIKRTIMRSVVISMCGSYSGALVSYFSARSNYNQRLRSRFRSIGTIPWVCIEHTSTGYGNRPRMVPNS